MRAEAINILPFRGKAVSLTSGGEAATPGVANHIDLGVLGSQTEDTNEDGFDFSRNSLRPGSDIEKIFSTGARLVNGTQ
jgi:hypothetical protein